MRKSIAGRISALLFLRGDLMKGKVFLIFMISVSVYSLDAKRPQVVRDYYKMLKTMDDDATQVMKAAQEKKWTVAISAINHGDLMRKTLVEDSLKAFGLKDIEASIMKELVFFMKTLDKVFEIQQSLFTVLSNSPYKSEDLIKGRFLLKKILQEKSLLETERYSDKARQNVDCKLKKTFNDEFFNRLNNTKNRFIENANIIYTIIQEWLTGLRAS